MKKLLMFAVLLAANVILPQETYALELQAGSSAKLAAVKSPSQSDARIMAIETIFKKYDSPLVTYAATYVKYADQYGVDWRLLASISGLESTFGRFMISGTYNAYGWGSGVIYFKSWEDGIATITKSLREDYMDKWGAKDVWEIGPIYAESKTWSQRVSYFMGQISEEYIKLTSPKLVNL